MGVQLAAEEQTGVDTVMVLLQITAAAKPPDADAGAFRREQVGEQIVSLLVIAEIQKAFVLQSCHISNGSQTGRNMALTHNLTHNRMDRRKQNRQIVQIIPDFKT